VRAHGCPWGTGNPRLDNVKGYNTRGARRRRRAAARTRQPTRHTLISRVPLIAPQKKSVKGSELAPVSASQQGQKHCL